jgi:CheY-like chemotaxis protein
MFWQHLVELMGSTICVESPWQADGSPGSRFFFELTGYEQIEDPCGPPQCTTRALPPLPPPLPAEQAAVVAGGVAASTDLPMQPREQGSRGLPARMQVLVVDDDTMNRRIMRFKLEQAKEMAPHGFQISEAASGEEVMTLYHGMQQGTGTGAGDELGVGAEQIAEWDMVLIDEHLSTEPSNLRGSQVSGRE